MITVSFICARKDGRLWWQLFSAFSSRVSINLVLPKHVCSEWHFHALIACFSLLFCFCILCLFTIIYVLLTYVLFFFFMSFYIILYWFMFLYVCWFMLIFMLIYVTQFMFIYLYYVSSTNCWVGTPTPSDLFCTFSFTPAPGPSGPRCINIINDNIFGDFHYFRTGCNFFNPQSPLFCC